jgi:amino acid transporter
MMMYAISLVSLLALRKKEPDLERPFKTPFLSGITPTGTGSVVIVYLPLSILSPAECAVCRPLPAVTGFISAGWSTTGGRYPACAG